MAPRKKKSSKSKAITAIKPPHPIIEDCVLKDTGTILRNPTIKNCTLEDVEIYSATISNSKLYNCRISKSTVLATELHSCKIFDSTIQGSKLHNSTLYSTKYAESNLKACKSESVPWGFRRFPPQIRQMIMLLCFDARSTQTPALIIALRGDTLIYKEAIKLFHMHQYIIVTGTFAKRVGTMSVETLPLIQKLQFMMLPGVPLRDKFLPREFLLHQKVEEVELYGVTFTDTGLTTWIPWLLEKMPLLKVVSFRPIQMLLTKFPPKVELSRSSIIKTTKCLNIAYKTPKRYERHEWKVTWEAEKGQMLTWNESLPTEALSS